MNLTPSQIETIETYLLSWGLEYQDFYEEMLDHFVSDIEQRMQQEDFETAFTQTKAAFSNKKFKGAFGLKAFEAEYIYGIQQELKKKLRSKMKEQFTSWRIVMWILLILNFVQNFEINKNLALSPFAFIIMCGMILPLLFIPFRDSWKLRPSWILTVRPVEVRTKKSLFHKTRMSAIVMNTITLFGLPVSLLNLYNAFSNELGIEKGNRFFLVLGILLSITLTSLAWAQIELVLEERFKLNLK